MASEFQPEEPYSDAAEPASRQSVVFTAAVSALMVVMILALAAPRLVEDYANSWPVTFGAGALAFVIILGIGFFRRSAASSAAGEEGGKAAS